MSPEQLKSARDVDARADVWSLGVILYQLTTGRVPFRAESLGQLMASVLTEPPVPLRELRTDLPAEFEALVASCLEKDLARRCPSVATVACVLARVAPARSRHLADRVVSSLDGDTVADPVVPVKVVSATEFGTVSGTVTRIALPDDATHVMVKRSRSRTTTLALAGGGAVLLSALVVGALLIRRGDRTPAAPPVASEALPSPPEPAPSSEAVIAADPALTALVVADPIPSMPDGGAATSTSKRPRGPGAGGRVPPPSPSPARSAGPQYNPLDHL
jgi:serine/threonine-protein kinase